MLFDFLGKPKTQAKTKAKNRPGQDYLTVTHYTILMFVGTILIGTALLMLPVAHKTELSFVDALFTATSATCVTGLLTINVAEVFSTFGETVILVLIELGAIGILTVSSLFLLMLGKSLSFRDSSIIHDTFTASHKINTHKLIVSIFTYLLIFEGAGALFFTFLWWPEMSFKEALYHGTFHSISAFCNAGISTFTDGLSGYSGDIASNIIFMILFIAGGIGFLTIDEIYDRVKHRLSSFKIKKENRPRKRAWSLQFKLVFLYTFFSIVICSIFLLVFEYDNAHFGMALGDQVTSAIFHVSSSRSAGFSTIDITKFNSATIYMFLFLMFIGGAPISTAGGIKVTTIGLIIGMGISRWKGMPKTHIMSRTIPDSVLSRAISIVFIAIIVLAVSFFLLLIAEAPFHETDAHNTFLPLLFEAVSAFGTVGLSMGITPSLSVFGKVLITILMLIGRLGPLTVAMVVATGSTSKKYEYAEETVMVG